MSEAPSVWPLGLYAPGKYICKCAICEKQFDGDKRAVQCLECAVRHLRISAEAAEAERDRCHARLEIDHCFKLGDDDDLVRHEIPMDERASFPDGIMARDETIKLVERRAEAAERENAECRRRNEEMDREITGLRNSYWEERKAHLAAEAREARLSEALRPFSKACDELDETDEDNCHIWEHPAALNINIADLRAAHAALSGSGSGWRDEHIQRFTEALCAEDIGDPLRASGPILETVAKRVLDYVFRRAAPQQGGE